MTPKEKAVELYYNFSKCKDKSNSYFIIPIVGDAKQCALIAVDEILELDVVWYDKQLVIDYPKSYKNHQTIEFWEEVKQEIEKL